MKNYNLNCPYCNKQALLKPASYVKGPGYEDSYLYVCSGFPACNAYVGVHEGTNKPKGTLANKELRVSRIIAHKAIDALWNTAQPDMKRDYRKIVYKAIALALNMGGKEFHIGEATLEQCKQVVQKRELISLYTRDMIDCWLHDDWAERQVLGPVLLHIYKLQFADMRMHFALPPNRVAPFKESIQKAEKLGLVSRYEAKGRKIVELTSVGRSLVQRLEQSLQEHFEPQTA